jgi:hypothetical protein
LLGQLVMLALPLAPVNHGRAHAQRLGWLVKLITSPAQQLAHGCLTDAVPTRKRCGIPAGAQPFRV